MHFCPLLHLWPHLGKVILQFILHNYRNTYYYTHAWYVIIIETLTYVWQMCILFCWYMIHHYGTLAETDAEHSQKLPQKFFSYFTVHF